MKAIVIAGTVLLALAACTNTNTTSTADPGQRLVPDSSGKCTQMVGAQTYRVKCPDQK